MFYNLNRNVYLVNGKNRGCIYDFNSSKLYSINNELSNKIDWINKEPILVEKIEPPLRAIFEQLVQLGILTADDTSVTRDIMELRKEDSGIQFAWIEITNQCNLRCRHCYNESNMQCNSEMSVSDYKLVVNNLVNLGIQKVQIIGGEPFLNPSRLREMLDYTVGKIKFIEVFTNGTLITSEWVDFFAERKIHVALSVYSYEKDEHDKVTGQKGSWEKTNHAISELKACGVDYRVCNVLMKDIDLGTDGSNLYELSEEKDIVRMSGRGNFSLLSDELIHKKLITKQSFRKPLNKNFIERLVSGHNCFRERMYISSNMEIFPCVMERRLKHGAITKQSGIVLDNNIRNLSKDKIEGCSSCEYRYACFDCRPDSLTGEAFEKPWYCTYDPIRGEWADEEEFIAGLKCRWGTEKDGIEETKRTIKKIP